MGSFGYAKMHYSLVRASAFWMRDNHEGDNAISRRGYSRRAGGELYNSDPERAADCQNPGHDRS